MNSFLQRDVQVRCSFFENQGSISYKFINYLRAISAVLVVVVSII